MADMFSKQEISQELKLDIIKNNIWNSNCPVPMERLMLINVSYYDFNYTPNNDGKMIVMDVIADSTINIFKELYKKKFPINKIKLINEYNGDDFASMEDNNSYAFSCREIINQPGVFSLHSYGLAVDINPLQNPYINITDKIENVNPSQGVNYINRSNLREGMVENILNKHAKQNVISLFKENGYSIWGGEWNTPIDWHHFQLPRKEAIKLASLNRQEAQIYFDQNLLNPSSS